jgi:hypothetical protein
MILFADVLPAGKPAANWNSQEFLDHQHPPTMFFLNNKSDNWTHLPCLKDLWSTFLSTMDIIY